MDEALVLAVVLYSVHKHDIIGKMAIPSDLFEKVVPLAVHQSLMAFEGRKAEIVNTEVGRLREATQLMNR